MDFSRVPLLMPEFKPPRNYALADAFYEALEESIEEFQEKLEADQQIIATYETPRGEEIIVRDIGYQNPNMMIFYGEDSAGQFTSVLIHMNAAHLILKAIRVARDEETRRIGFRGQRESSQREEVKAE